MVLSMLIRTCHLLKKFSLFETEGTDATKDIGDVGQAFGTGSGRAGCNAPV